ncbi:hypothetical protein F5Y07DRAFT_369083 [Xylaria sp. FL0933]|nr:hypothetical protein F5Y07DRAFT_369083 [Xylaria sp. FL0933]
MPSSSYYANVILVKLGGSRTRRYLLLLLLLSLLLSRGNPCLYTRLSNQYETSAGRAPLFLTELSLRPDISG